MSEQFGEEGQAGSCLCPLSLPKDAAHGQGTGQGTPLVWSGTTGLAVGQQEQGRGCGGSGSTHLRVEELQVPKVSSTAFLGIYPLPSPHETAAAAGAVAGHTPRALLFVPWGSTTNSVGS